MMGCASGFHVLRGQRPGYGIFYNMFSVEHESLENRGTQLLVYRGLEHFISKSFDLSRYPLTDTVPCIYTIESSKELLPDYAAAEK